MARKDPGQSAGWIKLHRSITGWRWARDPNVFRLWVQLLLMVDYETGEPIRTTLPELSEETGLTFKQTRLAVEKLSSTGEIVVTVGKRRHGLLIAVPKFTEYQGHKTGQNVGHKTTTTETPINKGNNGNISADGGHKTGHKTGQENASPSFIKKEFKKKSEESRTREGTFDTEDFFQAALRRSYAEYEKEDSDNAGRKDTLQG